MKGAVYRLPTLFDRAWWPFGQGCKHHQRMFRQQTWLLMFGHQAFSVGRLKFNKEFNLYAKLATAAELNSCRFLPVSFWWIGKFRNYIAAALLNWLNEYRDKFLPLKLIRCVSSKMLQFYSILSSLWYSIAKSSLKLKLTNWPLNIGWPFNIYIHTGSSATVLRI